MPLAELGERAGVAVLRALDQDRIAEPPVIEGLLPPERLLDLTARREGRLHGGGLV
jgi:hypothetical protein